MRRAWELRLFLALSLVAVALSTWRTAAAASPSHAPPTARLVYARGEGTEKCPDDDSLRADVAAHLGYEPFQSEDVRTIVVTISRAGRGLRGEIVVRGAAGATLGRRELASAETDCSELASALVLAVSIAIDPLQVARPSPPASPPAPIVASVMTTPVLEAAPTTPLAEEPVKAPSPPGDPVTWRLALGAGTAFGAEPAPSFGATIEGGIRWRKASFGIEGRLDLPASLEGANGMGVRASRIAGTFVPCLHEGVFLVCGLATLGVLQGSGFGVTDATNDTTFLATAGARIGIEWPIYSVLALRVAADGAATLTRTTLHVAGQDLWTTPPFLAGLGLAAVGRFR
jgi:hypothetical protein